MLLAPWRSTTTYSARSGGTPLVRLGRIHPAGNLVAKLEHTNPGGSVKERIAVSMIDAAETRRTAPAGGNDHRTHLWQHGGWSGDGGCGSRIPGHLHGARQSLQREDRPSTRLRGGGDRHPDRPSPRTSRVVLRSCGDEWRPRSRAAFRPDQYSNLNNPLAHYLTTGPEIWQQTDGMVDVLVAGVGTGGTISGAARYLEGAAGRHRGRWSRPGRKHLHRPWSGGRSISIWSKELVRTSTRRRSTWI